jgi:hypothetical protein
LEEHDLGEDAGRREVRECAGSRRTASARHREAMTWTYGQSVEGWNVW